MKMRSIEKLWTIVYKISEVTQITPSGKPCKIDATRVIWPVIGEPDAGHIFEKLDQDEKVIRLLQVPTPKSKRNDLDADCYIFEVLESFWAYRDDLYRRYSFDVEKLDPLNLKKIIDVAMDIKHELELTDTDIVQIPLLPNIVKFNELLPANSQNFRDQYKRYRWQAVEFLKKQGVVRDIDYKNGLYDYQDAVSLNVDRFEFGRFFDKLTEQSKEKLAKKDSRQQVAKITKPTFDKEKSEIKIGDGKCPIPLNTIEYFTCLLAFENFGERIPETDILDRYNGVVGGMGGKTAVYDARGRLNKKVKEKIGIDQLFAFDAAHVWIRSELFE